MLRIGPLPELDHTPVGFAITAMLLCWAVVRIRLFEIVPVAANTLFLRIPDPVLVTDPAGRLVRANDAALRRFGTLDRHIGRPLAEAFTGHPEIVSAILAAETHPERRTTLSSGATWWTIGSNALEESGKRQQGRLVILRDITEQKRTELQLLQAKVELEQTLARADALAREAVAANNAKSSFLTQVSHDLRTPLHAILGMTEVLRAGPLGTAQQAEVATISDAGDALLRLINDLLDLSRIEAGRIDLAHDPFLIDDVLDQIADLLGPAARRKGLGFVHWIEPGLPGGLRGDSGRLRQILINLVGNAVKFTERGGITIRVSRKDILLGIEISDTGRGISPGHLPGLFTPFNRGDPEAARHTEGTGLGLAISRRLAEAMGGVINVRSTPGQGTAFTLELPIVDDGATPVLFSRIASQVAGRRITVAISDPGRRTAVIQGLLSLGASAHPLGREQPPGSVPLVVDDAEEAAGLVAEWRAAGSTVVIAAGAQARPSPAAVPLTRRSLASALLSAAASTAAGASPTVPSGPRRRVLLADDNPLSLRVSAAQLAQCNCTVDTATGGLCALERLATQDYDLVVLDGQMPDLNGWEVAFRIRQGPKDARNARTPVIALTADLTPDSHLRWLNAGTAVVLGKPVRTRELCEIIERCCPKTS